MQTMNPAAPRVPDQVQDRLSEFVYELEFDAIPAESIAAAKIRIVDTTGALLAGLDAEVNVRLRRAVPEGHVGPSATVLATSARTGPDLAAFVNGTAARTAELTDTFHLAGATGGHPSDLIMPVLAAAEYAGVGGREYLTAVVAAYEVYLRLSEATLISPFDYTTLIGIGSAAGAAKAFGLPLDELRSAVSIAAVSGNPLRQGRTGTMTSWKAAASGHAGRAGVQAALAAAAGVEGPSEPFVGVHGWLDHVARRRFDISQIGGQETPFMIDRTLIKPRHACGATMASLLAAEKLCSEIQDPSMIERVHVETYKTAVDRHGTDENMWNPQTSETADHSVPYVVAATLSGGSTPDIYDPKYLFDAGVRDLMNRMSVAEDPAATKAFGDDRPLHYSTVTVTLTDGSVLVGRSGGDHGDLSDPKAKDEIEAKFRTVSAGLGASDMDQLLSDLWSLESVENLSAMLEHAVIPNLR